MRRSFEKITDSKKRHRREEDIEVDPEDDPDEEEEEDPDPLESFRPGSIVNLTLKSFLTYDYAVFQPGPKLNVIIGPNGSGKSSFVCALALVLGFTPKVLGRAKDPKHFIKYGEEQATVEVELYKASSNGKNLKIRRDIYKSKADKWRVNEVASKKEDVQDIVKHLNIQIDNLCQFLPQDRVVEFAQLEPCGLLRETEKAVGGLELLGCHEKLIELKKEQLQVGKSLDQRKKILDDLIKKNQTCEAEVKRFKERESLREKLDLLRKKKPWLEFEAERVKALELKKNMKILLNQKKEAEKKLEPLKNKKEEYAEEVSSFEKEGSKQKETLRKLDHQRKQLGDQLENLDDQIDAHKSELEQLAKRAEDRKKKDQELRTKLDAYKQELERAPSDDVLASQIKIVEEKMMAVNKENEHQKKEREEVEEEKTALGRNLRELQTKITDVRNIRKAKEKVIAARWPDTFTALNWIHSHENLFTDKVYGPICLEMNVEQQLHVLYLEQAVGNTLSAFVTTNAKDREIIMKELVDKQQLRLAVLYTPGLENKTFEHQFPISQVAQYGITHFLDEVFESHPIIKDTLRNHAALHMVGAGTEYTEKCIDRVLTDTAFREVFTPDAQHRKSQSLYGKRQISTMRIPLRTYRDSVLSTVINPREEANIVEESKQIENNIQILSQQLQDMNSIEREIMERINSLKLEKDNILKTKKMIQMLKTKIEAQVRLIESIREEENIEDKTRKINDLIKKKVLSRLKLSHDMLGVVRQLTDVALQSDVVLLQKMQRKHQLIGIEQLLAQHMASLRGLENDVQSAVQEFEVSKKLVSQLKVKAEQVIQITSEVKSLFEELPNTLEDLEDEIISVKTRVDSIFLSNPKILEDYERRKEEINNLQKTLDNEERVQEKANHKIEEIRKVWLPKLEDYTSKITESFQNFMSNIGCAGEVRLDQKEDYSEWGMEIYVKFRSNTPMCRLDAHVQSGGERSVATMLYLLSLQELTDCPFRLVDEINQGMDPNNERMIFQQVVKTACRNSLPQYFLITPKLLTDLDYSTETTVLCIYNGPWIPPGWDPLNVTEQEQEQE